jgi:hypothetical protein
VEKTHSYGGFGWRTTKRIAAWNVNFVTTLEKDIHSQSGF